MKRMNIVIYITAKLPTVAAYYTMYEYSQIYVGLKSMAGSKSMEISNLWQI